jgi:hypothetical protein
MRLEPIITDLLYDNDCVVVPGFGAFLAIHASAKLNTHSHVVFPPSRNVGFNARIKHQDGMLSHAVSQLCNITMAEAQVRVDSCVAIWQNQLAVDHRVALDGLGVVFYDSVGQLQFVPDRQQNFLASSFGLMPMHLTVVRPDFGADKKGEGRLVDWNAARKYAAAAALLLLLGASWLMGSNYRSDIGMSSLNPFSPVIECDYSSVQTTVYPTAPERNYDQWKAAMEFPTNDEAAMAANDIALKQTEIRMESTPLDTEAKVSIQQSTAEHQASSGYAVIGGAFQDEGNAKRFLAKLKNRGYQSVFAGRKNDLQLVAYGVFRTMAEAELAQQDIISNGDAAWIKILE